MSNFLLFAVCWTTLLVIFYTAMFINDLFFSGEKNKNHIEEIVVADVQESPTIVPEIDISKEIQKASEEEAKTKEKEASKSIVNDSSKDDSHEVEIKFVEKQYQFSFDSNEIIRKSTMDMFSGQSNAIKYDNLI